jgi:S-(hydroxymethyl)glutathione dehydrogenase / alcohol dehydrogenase
MRAALWTATDRPLEIVDDLELVPLDGGQVKVRLAASGVCHTDLSIARGNLLHPMPAVLGHEGAGIVEEVGTGVTSVKPGDHVVLSWIAQCGRCYPCLRGQGNVCEAYPRGTVPSPFRRAGETVHQMMTTGTFAEITIVPEGGVVKIDDDVPLHLAALIGCGVLTGAGAALNTATIVGGDRVAVFGCGGVGLNAIQGASIAGASTLIAVDTNPAKLELATTFGATHLVDAADVDPVQAIKDLTDGRGADVTIEVVGVQATVEQALASTRRAGQCVVVGAAPDHVHVPLQVIGFVRSAVELRACYYGSANVRDDVPKLLGLWRSGALLLDELVSAEITLDDVESAFASIDAGTVTRSVIRY